MPPERKAPRGTSAIACSATACCRACSRAARATGSVVSGPVGDAASTCRSHQGWEMGSAGGAVPAALAGIDSQWPGGKCCRSAWMQRGAGMQPRRKKAARQLDPQQALQHRAGPAGQPTPSQRPEGAGRRLQPNPNTGAFHQNDRGRAATAAGAGPRGRWRTCPRSAAGRAPAPRPRSQPAGFRCRNGRARIAEGGMPLPARGARPGGCRFSR